MENKSGRIQSVARLWNRGQRSLRFAGTVLFLSAATLRADPHLTSWFTTYSGKYARIYASDFARTNGLSVTTWTNGSTVQSPPSYDGIQEIYSSSDWVYIRTTGLGSHIMGPWYLDAQHSMAFPAYPTNQQLLFRIPRSPDVAATKTANGGGAIGIFVDGVAMFNSWDAYYWNGSADVQGGGSGGYWNRDAYVNEGMTFDPANAHQPGSGQYHYHANPPALRYLLGDHVNFNSAAKTYSEATNSPTTHSPILAWVSDGYPLYGPYGYSSSSNSASGVRRMVSGYVIRNGQNGTSNLTANGRTTIPQWAVRLYNVASNILVGPNVSSSYPLGRYMEDNDYLGDHGYVQGVDFDLDEHNGRWCVTPEFPNGTYAYFVSIAPDGTPVFPYNIGRGYYGIPTGGGVSGISETVSTNFLGYTNLVPVIGRLAAGNGTVTLTWSALEGGSYQVQATTNLNSWSALAGGISPNQITAGYTNATALSGRFYRVARTGVAAFDGAGVTVFSTSSVAPGGSASRGTTVTVTITLPNSPPWPPANAPITSVTLAGTIAGNNISDDTQGTVLATFTIPSNAPTDAQNVAVTFTSGPQYTLTDGFTINE